MVLRYAVTKSSFMGRVDLRNEVEPQVPAAKYSDPRGVRLFAMVHVYSFQMRHATFYQQTFTPVLRTANLFRGRQLSQDELRHIV
jgi:hypothetical protein